MATRDVSISGDDSRANESEEEGRNVNTRASAMFGRSTGKCPLPYFLLSALTVGQVFLLSLFFLWSIKTCYTKYHRIDTVYQVKSVPHHPLLNESRNHGSDFHLGGHNNNTFRHLKNHADAIHAGSLDLKLKTRLNVFRNTTIVGLTGLADVDIAIKWFESLRRLHLNYDVTLVARDREAFDVLSKYRSRSGSSQTRQLKVAYVPLSSVRLSSPYPAELNYIGFLLHLLKEGKNVLLVDTNTIWTKDPLSFVWDEFESCDMTWFLPGANGTVRPSFVFVKQTTATIAALIGSCKNKIDSRNLVDTEGAIQITSVFWMACGRRIDGARMCQMNAPL